MEPPLTRGPGLDGAGSRDTGGRPASTQAVGGTDRTRVRRLPDL
ncbi:hypothetical protein ABZ807_03580 [Micromonospora sp. NPDC047548]